MDRRERVRIGGHPLEPAEAAEDCVGATRPESEDRQRDRRGEYDAEEQEEARRRCHAKRRAVVVVARGALASRLDARRVGPRLVAGRLGLDDARRAGAKSGRLDTTRGRARGRARGRSRGRGIFNAAPQRSRGGAQFVSPRGRARNKQSCSARSRRAQNSAHTQEGQPNDTTAHRRTARKILQKGQSDFTKQPQLGTTALADVHAVRPKKRLPSLSFSSSRAGR